MNLICQECTGYHTSRSQLPIAWRLQIYVRAIDTSSEWSLKTRLDRVNQVNHACRLRPNRDTVSSGTFAINYWGLPSFRYNAQHHFYIFQTHTALILKNFTLIIRQTWRPRQTRRTRTKCTFNAGHLERAYRGRWMCHRWLQPGIPHWGTIQMETSFRWPHFKDQLQGFWTFLISSDISCTQFNFCKP